MKARVDKQFVFNRRALVASGFGALGFLLVGSRLAWLQLSEAENYQAMAADNRFNFRLIVPPRGAIIDRNNVVVAGVRLDFRAILEPEKVEDVQATLARVGQVIELSEQRLKTIERDLKSRGRAAPVMIEDNLSWQAFSALAVRAPEIPGVRVETGEIRAYPKGPAFAHLVGYVGKVADKDLQKENIALLRNPSYRIGKSGLEKAYEHHLRGVAGARKIEVDAFGRVIKEWSGDVRPPVPGDPLKLTVDAHLQEYAAWRLREDSASAVLMDIETGDILAMTSTPAFDPNSFVSGISYDEYGMLREDERTPLRNKPFSGLYPPGSTFKTVVALAALEAGAMPALERVNCIGHTQLGSHRFHCWKRGGHGMVNMHEAIKTSCDIYFYECARRVGPARIAKMARIFGLGETYDLAVSGQKEGIVPDPNWKRGRYGRGWLPGETYNYGIGQGYLLCNPLQLCVMTARLAAGRSVEPRLVIDSPETPRFESLPVARNHVDMVREAMASVSNEMTGTAFRNSQLDLGGLMMAGKTGTAQVRRITLAERRTGVLKNEDLPWRLRDHALFVAFAPSDAPRFAISVVVEHGGGGSTVAAPRARDIMREALLRDPATRIRLQKMAAEKMGDIL